ncbi:MAG: SRPBCC family protein [Desulfobacter sp.]
MPVVKTSMEITDIDIDVLWKNISAFDRYPNFMDDVLEVTCDSDENGPTSAWTVMLNGSELSWIERDEFHPPEKIVFEQIEGDVDVYKGTWEIDYNEAERKAVVTLETEFDLGIPSLADMLNPMGIEAIKNNSAKMLSAIQNM